MMNEIWKFVHKHPWISYWTVTLVVSKVTTCLTDIVTVLRTGQVPDRRTIIQAPDVSTTKEVEETTEVEVETNEENEEESEEAPDAF